MTLLKQESILTESSPSSARSANSTAATAFVETNPNAWTFHRLPSREMKRRFWHMFPGLLAFAMHTFPHADPVSPIVKWSILACGIAISIRILLGFRLIQRQGENKGIGAIVGYTFSVLLMVLAFPRHLELGLAVLAVLAFGDGSATLVGLTFRGPRLPWNRGKSWSGLMGFIVIGSMMTAWMYWGEACNPRAAEPKVTFAQSLLIVFPAVSVSALAESVRSRINDNIRVGIVAAASLTVMHFLRLL